VRPASSRQVPSPSRQRDPDTDTPPPGPALVDNRTTKRSASTKQTVRSAAKAPLLTVKQMILGGIALVVILVVAIGYDPFMCYMHTKKLDEGPGLQDRKDAAAALLGRYEKGDVSQVFSAFSVRLSSTTPDLREAAAYGIELIGTRSTGRGPAIERLADELSKCDAAGKAVMIRSLAAIGKAAAASAQPSGTGEPDKDVAKAAQALIPCSAAADLPAEVRATAVEALSELVAPGVCKQLISVAAKDKGEVREKALRALTTTALPDAVPDLLEAMAGGDKDLAAAAKIAFGKVRSQAKSETLVPLVTHAKDDVRREIVDALAERKGDAVAAKGITTALKDKVVAIRLAAVKAVPVTGLSGPMAQLGELARDPEESVRIANAETLGQLRDPDSRNVILEAFKNDLQGKTMEAYTLALGRRSYGKDLTAIGMVIDLLKANPGAEASLCQALVLLSFNGQQGRKEKRAAWKSDQWNAWFNKISERDKLRKSAEDKIEAIRKGNIEDRSKYPQLKDQIEKEMDILEKCKEMCKPDDLEDVASLDTALSRYSKYKDFFIKGASFDMRR
jgi:HEAT repeat protein